MAFDTTMTESDIEAATRHLSRSLDKDQPPFEPDLAVDGLSDSLLTRVIRALGFS